VHARSRSPESGQHGGWRSALASGEVDRVRDAVEEIGRFGDATWLGALAKVSARHPELTDAVTTAQRRLGGSAEIARTLRDRGTDVAQRFDERVLALQAWVTVSGGAIDWGFFNRVVRDPSVHDAVACSAVEALFRIEGVSEQVLRVFSNADDVPATLARMTERIVQVIERFTEPTDLLGAAARRDLDRRRDERLASYEKMKKELEEARSSVQRAAAEDGTVKKASSPRVAGGEGGGR
jgi:hypothetical protein